MYCSNCGKVVLPGAAFCSSCGRKLPNGDSISQYFRIGSYLLGVKLPDTEGLTEFSHTEYKTLGRQFRGEKDYNAMPVTFLSRKWKLMLGTVDGQLYKIALHQEFQKEAEAKFAADDAFLYCATALGPPTTQAVGLFTWDACDGSIVMQMAEVDGTYALNLFLTSGCVRDFR